MYYRYYLYDRYYRYGITIGIYDNSSINTV